MDIRPNIRKEDFEYSFTVVDSHTVGEPTRIVLGGLPELKGSTMIEKKKYFVENYDFIRTALMFEPRGHRDMFGALITEPVHEEADFGIIFIETAGCLNMCGHGTIGAVTVLIETGVIKAEEPVTHVTLDAPAGIIEVDANVENGKVKSVTLTNVPAFVYKEGLTTVVDGREIKYDLSFGGSFFTLVDISQFGLDINTSTVSQIIDIGMKILPQVNKEVEIRHPELDITETDVCEFYGTPHDEGSSARNVVVFGKQQADRSPCGTGTSAKMAFLHKNGKLDIGQKYVNESFIGTKFIGEIKGETKVGDYDAVIPKITGSAYITGCGTYLIDPDDPLKYGFLID
jgi:proline racemase